MNILIAIITLFFAKVIVSALGMKMMTELLSVILDVGSLALIVIFQPEIRRFLMHFGQKYMIGKKGSRFFNRLFGGNGNATATSDTVKEIAEACGRYGGQDRRHCEPPSADEPLLQKFPSA